MDDSSSRHPLIYIAASYEDAAWRDAIRAELERQAGKEVEVWSGGGSLEASPNWVREFWQAQKRAAVGVILLSRHTVSSEFVQKEVDDLRNLGMPLFPILIEECEWRSFSGISDIAIFDDARPLNSYSLEIRQAKIEEFARIVLAALGDAAPGQSPSQRDYTSEEREGALTRGEMSREQQEAADEARLREWRTMVAELPAGTDGLQRRLAEGKLGREDLANLIRTVARDREQILKWFETEEALPEEARSMIAQLGNYETALRKMLNGLPAAPTTEMPSRTEAEPDQERRKKKAPRPDTPATLELDINFFSQFARRILGWADVFREKRGEPQVGVEHLIAALHQSDNDTIRDAFRKARIDWSELRSILQPNQWSIPVAPDEVQAEASEAKVLPPLSANARAALTAAVASARSDNSPVLPHHLFVAVLSVDLPVTRALKERGVGPESISQRVPNTPRRIGAPRGRTRAGYDIPGVNSDVAKGIDLLGIEGEVAALCSVIAARDVQPPLSIGLFGDWGTGKSFFMEKMWERIVALAKDGSAEDSPFASHIVQLKFNAWYYIDTNLWATLGSEIFRGLADALAADTNQPAQARERLLAAAASQRDVLAEAEHKAKVASEQLQQNEERLTRLASDEAEIDARLNKPSVLLRAVYRVVVQDSNVQNSVRAAAATLNIPTVEAAATETKAQLMELRGVLGLAQATWLAAKRQKHVTILMAVSGLAILALLYLLPAFTTWAKAIHLDSAVARVAGLITVLAAAVSPFLAKARKALDLIGEARKQSLNAVTEEQKKKKAELIEQKAKIQEEAAGVQKRVEEASANLKKLEEQLQDLRADRQMSNFIKTRNESRDYTSHLGVIARARDDFQRLSNLLEEVRKQTVEEKQGKLREEKLLLPRIDRIILYIDDLDRCPEDKVVDVLQAVHLLLAFPLFVVVVGVDPRWLLHSLKQHSRAFQPDQNGAENELNEEGLHWQSTPLNYLEKIFQIPFSLRPMQPEGFGELIETLTEPKESSPVVKPPAPVAGTTEGSTRTEQTAAVTTGGAPSAARETLRQVPPPTPVAQTADSGASRPRPSGEQAPEKPPAFKPLNLSQDEREFMKRLHPFIATPRAAKRFVNVYRLLRGLSDEDEAFRGSKERAEHRAVLVLLAILTGHPDQGTEFLRDLLNGEAADRSWWEFVDSYRARATPKSQLFASQAEAEQWRQFFEKIDQVQNDVRETGSCVDFDESCDAFVKWAGQVSRFSFQSARVILQRSGEQSATRVEPVKAQA